MKRTIMAMLTLLALSCQKEKLPEQQVLNSSAQSDLSTGASALLNDSNFVKFYKISLPIFKALQHGRKDLIELYNDTLLYYKECRKLAPKLGFKDSATLVKYFKQVNVLAPKIAKAHATLTLRQYQEAVEQLNKNNLQSGPCDAVIGEFTMNVAECASLGLIPVAGEVLAGTCMIGALISYNSGMQSCSGSA